MWFQVNTLLAFRSRMEKSPRGQGFRKEYCMSVVYVCVCYVMLNVRDHVTVTLCTNITTRHKKWWTLCTGEMQYMYRVAPKYNHFIMDICLQFYLSILTSHQIYNIYDKKRIFCQRFFLPSNISVNLRNTRHISKTNREHWRELKFFWKLHISVNLDYWTQWPDD